MHSFVQPAFTFHSAGEPMRMMSIGGSRKFLFGSPSQWKGKVCMHACFSDCGYNSDPSALLQ